MLLKRGILRDRMKTGFVETDDRVIRCALIESLSRTFANDSGTRIIEELAFTSGSARIDVAVVNGILHGYELKSDLDTLTRLPGQMMTYNDILDQVTLVVGKSHIYDAIRIVPDWWGITMAKLVVPNGTVEFFNIRDAQMNPSQDSVAIASLLWRSEVLSILESMGRVGGIQSKRRSVLHERLAQVLDEQSLKWHVRRSLFTRANWRSDAPCTPGGD